MSSGKGNCTVFNRLRRKIKIIIEIAIRIKHGIRTRKLTFVDFIDYAALSAQAKHEPYGGRRLDPDPDKAKEESQRALQRTAYRRRASLLTVRCLTV
jgi:hypothetical protein